MATLKKADPDPHKPEVALDKISVNASEFKHIASSEGYGNAQSEDSKDLVHVKYFKVNPKSPVKIRRN
ncbi:vacuolar protein sorting-associated protein vps13 [Rhizophagus irregularis DAOM 181602=DAOM 197198]|nr:vacuolar protein sorting-associated protein vps13 [Rhizophagus irregularis DAOM 181602=DAOM 197198]CAG8520190.1 20622_t:CDS:2 [Rhizophagus irregularis]